MGKPAETDKANSFNPVALQANLLKAGSLWQQFIQNQVEYLSSNNNTPVDNSAFLKATTQWAFNLAKKPETLWQANWSYLTSQARLWQGATARMMGLPQATLSDEPVRDRRFRDPAWTEYPAAELMMHGYLNFSAYMKTLLSEQEGLDPKEAEKAEFFVNSMVEALAPNNFASTNPQVWNRVLETNGENLVKGMQNLLQDFQNGELRIRMTDTQAFELGRDIATTPGKVVFRNELIELIQYTPTTEKVRKTPLLIVPPWINKYYILDLREKNSFVKWAVEQGHTVFMISWRNPGSEQSELSFADYLEQGALAALDAVEQATGERELNIASYCLGGTLTSALLAYLEGKGEADRVKSATFFTTLIDFSEPGEIGVFLDEQQVCALEKLMEQSGGYLDGKNMGAAFNMLRANDLIWSFFVNLYLLGNDPMPFDLLYWNSDSTRMPQAMHSYYLRNMYLHNKLRQPCGLQLNGVDIDLSQVKTPAYFVSAYDDHIAPWKTTYLGAQLFAGPVRFVLGESGHIAGIVNPASANKYGHWTNDQLAADAETWFSKAEKSNLSWWHDWDQWVGEFAGEQVPARQEGAGQLPVLTDAPGTYVKG
ncbi:MAG: class I poly(R)-hydroxyalkanoic acid synthase [Thiolinea sp.]